MEVQEEWCQEVQRQGGETSSSCFPRKTREAVEEDTWPPGVLVTGGQDLPAFPGGGRLG